MLVEVDGLLAGGDEGDGCEAVELLAVLLQGLDWDTPLGQAGTLSTLSTRLTVGVQYEMKDENETKVDSSWLMGFYSTV